MTACTLPHRPVDLIIDGPIRMTRNRWDALVRCVHGVVLCEVTGRTEGAAQELAHEAIGQTLTIGGDQ